MSALLLGHRGRCFDVRVSGDGLKALTASEDGCVKLWGLVQRTCIATLQHSSDAEALRCCFLPCSSSLVSCGSDGRALVWGQGGRLLAELSHGSDQIYACEPVPDSASLLTAADDAVFVWDLNSPAEPLSARRFEAAGGNGFGGVERNPDNRAYVFDLAVSPCDHSSFAAALSDGSVRVQDVRHGGTPSGPFLPSGALPPRLTTGLTYAELVGAAETDGPPCHATGVTWVGGDALLASLGSGDSVLIDLRMNRARALLRGHSSACFGSLAVGGGRAASWASDGSVCLWELRAAQGLVDAPLRRWSIDGFPVYSCALGPGETLLCAGGGSEKSFLGTPVYCIQLSPS